MRREVLPQRRQLVSRRRVSSGSDVPLRFPLGQTQRSEPQLARGVPRRALRRMAHVPEERLSWPNQPLQATAKSGPRLTGTMLGVV